MNSFYRPILAHGGINSALVFSAMWLLLVVAIWKFAALLVGSPPPSKTSDVIAFTTVKSPAEADLICARLAEAGIAAYVPEKDQIHMSPFPHAFTVCVAAGDLDAAKLAMKGETGA
jgi:hypothetical protein